VEYIDQTMFQTIFHDNSKQLINQCHQNGLTEQKIILKDLIEFQKSMKYLNQRKPGCID
jgi:hypothetical protein